MGEVRLENVLKKIIIILLLHTIINKRQKKFWQFALPLTSIVAQPETPVRGYAIMKIQNYKIKQFIATSGIKLK